MGMIRLLIATICACALLAGLSYAQKQPPPPRKIAITFDDLPMNSQFLKNNTTGLLRATSELVGAIVANGVPAIGFVNEVKLEVDGVTDPERVALLEVWTGNGLELGNHTYSHLDLHKVSLEEFKEDIVRGDNVTRSLMGERGLLRLYFRHPYLHTGRDLETRDAVVDFLSRLNYDVAPVTIDNGEWIFARAYDIAESARDKKMKGRVLRTYRVYMETMVAYYEQQSVALFGREIPQILLLHANLLNAASFGEIAYILKRRGYEFISLAEALEDEAYQSEDTYTGPGGISWIHRWALTQGKKGDFFAEEPLVPDFIVEASQIHSN